MHRRRKLGDDGGLEFEKWALTDEKYGRWEGCDLVGMK